MIETVGTRRWSEPRVSALRRCPRLRAWKYEVAPRGRAAGAPRDARLAWALSRMTDLSGLVREVVRELVVESLAAARAGVPVPFEPDEALRRLRATWRDAREHWRGGAPESIPSPERHRPVFEVFYDSEDDGLREVAERAPRCLRAWLESDLFARLRDLPPDDLLWIDPVGADEDDGTAFETDGVRVHATPDLVRRSDGATEIVEWRVEPATIATPDRLGPRGLWVVAMLGVDPASLAARVVHLHEDAREEVLPLGETELRAAAERIRHDVAELDATLGTDVGLIPRLDAAECAGCGFRAACWPATPGGTGR